MALAQKRANGKCYGLKHLTEIIKGLKYGWNASEACFNEVPRKVEARKRWDANGSPFCGLWVDLVIL